MATTTNYGWTTPDDTALVKDGASAIRTLGSSIDTTVKALSPGTTSGDIDYYTSATTKARLAKGTDGQVLTLASGLPSWATSASGGMTLLSTTTLSGASTTISSISGAYTNLEIFVYGMTNNTANGTALLTFNALSTNNCYAYLQFTNNATVAARNLSNDGLYFNLSTDLFNRTNANNFVSITVKNYASATTNKGLSINGYYVGASFNQGFAGAGGINTTSAINQIVLSNSGGTFSAGTVLIYGVK
jgi:hypothetical protein